MSRAKNGPGRDCAGVAARTLRSRHGGTDYGVARRVPATTAADAIYHTRFPGPRCTAQPTRHYSGFGFLMMRFAARTKAVDHRRRCVTIECPTPCGPATNCPTSRFARRSGSRGGTRLVRRLGRLRRTTPSVGKRSRTRHILSTISQSARRRSSRIRQGSPMIAEAILHRASNCVQAALPHPRGTLPRG